MKNLIFLLALMPVVCFGQIKLNNNTVTIDAAGKINSQYIDGYFNYSDSSSQATATPIAYTTGSPLKLGNDGQGGQTTGAYAPYGITQLFDTITGNFDFSELAIGDEVIIRFNLDITTSATNQEFFLYLDLAVGGSFPYSLYDGVFAFKTAGKRQIGVNIPLYIGTADTRDNPGQLMFSSDANATITVNSYYITTKRRFY